MPSTPYIKPTQASVSSGTVTNVNALVQSGTGVASITNDATISLDFPNLSSFFPSPNTRITGISFKYSGTPSGITGFSSLTSTAELTNANFVDYLGNPISSPAIQNLDTRSFLSSDNNSPFSFEVSDPSAIVESIQLTEENLYNNAGLDPDAVNVLLPGIVVGTTRIRLKFVHNAFTSAGFAANMELDGNNVPSIKIFYEGHKVKILSPSIITTTPKIASNVVTNGASATNENALISTGNPPAEFNNTNHIQTSNFLLSNFGFNIPSNATINSVQFKIGVDRAVLPANGDFQLQYWFYKSGTTNYLKRNSDVLTTNENHIVRTNNYINSANNNFFTPDIINDLEIYIFWPIGSLTPNLFVDTITGIEPNTSNVAVSTNLGRVYLAGTPNTNNDVSSNSNPPTVTVSYSTGGASKIVIGASGPTKVKII